MTTPVPVCTQAIISGAMSGTETKVQIVFELHIF